MSKIVDFYQYSIHWEYFFETSSEKLEKLFYNSELGLIYRYTPWSELEGFFKRAFYKRKIKQGRPTKFSVRTELAILMLSAYYGYSDRELFIHLVGNWMFQRFAHLRLSGLEDLDYKIVYRIRQRYGEVLDIEKLQLVLTGNASWNEVLKDVNGVLMDATVVESRISYPTSIKLLQQSIERVYRHVSGIRRCLGLMALRTSYKAVSEAYKELMRYRKRRRYYVKRLIRRQLNLLDRLLTELDKLQKSYSFSLLPSAAQELSVIKEVYRQQRLTQQGERVSNPILSLYKPHVRPIFRGKLGKAKEFGLKVHFIKLGSLVFIEHIDNEAYNEGTRLKAAVEYSQLLLRSKVRLVGADKIYWSNSNRRYCTDAGIITNAVRKGRAGSNEASLSQVRRQINKARNSEMEGVIGHLKSHFNMNKVPYKSRKSEELYIFLSTVLHNSIEVGKRLSSREAKAA